MFSNLQDKRIFGGFGSWGSSTYVLKLDNLNPHYQIRLFMKIYLFDDWDYNEIDKDVFQLYVNDKLELEFNSKSSDGLISNINIWGAPDIDKVY